MAAKARTDNERRWSGWRIAGWGTAGVLLLVPRLAEFPWTLSDYVFAGLLMGSVGLALELAFRKSRSPAYRAAAATALAAAFLLVWINAAVGIIGSEDDPANLLYAGVLAMALSGVIVASFHPAAMARAMMVTAGAQALVAILALSAGLGASEPPGPVGILMLNGFFTLLWTIAAALFWKAGREEPAGSTR